ncbi:hypothetical protein D9M71_504630 [compost metagenome]
MTVELPPLYIYATEPGYINPPGLPNPGPNPAYVLLHQQKERNNYYGIGCWVGVK